MVGDNIRDLAACSWLGVEKHGGLWRIMGRDWVEQGDHHGPYSGPIGPAFGTKAEATTYALTVYCEPQFGYHGMQPHR